MNHKLIKFIALFVFLFSTACSNFLLDRILGNNSNDSQSSTVILPVDGSWNDLEISDNFGPRILSGEYDFHRGLDIQLELDDPIYAVADGTVVFSGTDSENYPRSGQFIILEHSENRFTGYLHLNSISSEVVEGAEVQQGDVIGFAGNSGEGINSIHLHFNYYVSENSGEIPSSSAESLPPLQLLNYSDTDEISLASVSLDHSNLSESVVSFQTSVPDQEQDLNSVNVIIRNQDDDILFEKTVEYSSRTNCGTDDQTTNSVQITPEDFKSSQSSYETTFSFQDIDLTLASGQTVTVEVTATDLSDNSTQVSQSYSL